MKPDCFLFVEDAQLLILFKLQLIGNKLTFRFLSECFSVIFHCVLYGCPHKQFDHKMLTIISSFFTITQKWTKFSVLLDQTDYL